MIYGLLLFPERRKSKVRRSKSRYKMLEADEQDSLELQPPRVGKTHTHTSILSLLPQIGVHCFCNVQGTAVCRLKFTEICTQFTAHTAYVMLYLML